MPQYLDKDALADELEKRKSELQSRITELGTFESNTLGLFQEVNLYDDILSIINTLEVKDVVLEKELTWKDIAEIEKISNLLEIEWLNSTPWDGIRDCGFYAEVLKRFKDGNRNSCIA